MRVFISFLLLLAFILLSSNLQSQSLENILDEEVEEEEVMVDATFKSIYLINSHTVKNPAKKELFFMISHRFGTIDQGFSDLFGLDNATIRLGFEYGLNDRLALGFGRSTYKSNYDFFAKYKVLRQSQGENQMPLSLSVLTSANIRSDKWLDEEREYLFEHRMEYAHQLLIARKFSNAFSLQLMPTYIHRNLVETAEDENDVFALGSGGRIKLTNRTAFTFEYHYLLSKQLAEDFESPLSLGFDVETGGHVFQLFFTNAPAIYDAAFIDETREPWSDKSVRFGFNISRVFSF